MSPLRALTTASIACLTLVLGVGPVAARERIAVYVGVPGDPTLTQNLSEVTIAKLAEAHEFEAVGTPELEVALHDNSTVRREGLAACFELPACLAEVGKRVNAPRALVGKVREEEAGYELELALVRTDTFQTDKRKTDRAPLNLAALMGALQTAVTEVLTKEAPPEEPAAAPPLVAPEPVQPFGRTADAMASAPGARTEAPAATAAPRDAGTAWTTYAGFAAAGLAVVALSAGVIVGGMASAPPSGFTRKERQDDIERRQQQATAANALFVSGGVLGAVAVVSFAWP